MNFMSRNATVSKSNLIKIAISEYIIKYKDLLEE